MSWTGVCNPSSNICQYKLFRMFFLRVLMNFSALCFATAICLLLLLVLCSSALCTFTATRAFHVSRWSLNNSNAYNIMTGKTDLHSLSPPRVSLLTSCTYRTRYLCGFEGDIVFGDCIFRVDPSGLLTRDGSCPTKSGSLSLSGLSIKAFAPDVFSNLSSVR